jgi:PAS domain S-box-containing protein
MEEPAGASLLPVIRAALDQTRSSACITTADLDEPGPTIVYVNPAYCAMTGHAMEDVIGATPRIMQGPLTSRGELDRLRSDLAAGRPFVGETVNYRKDGTPFLISWRIDPVVDERGTTTHYIATQEDITRLRRAERLLAAERSIDRSVATLLSRPADTEANVATLVADIADAVGGLTDHGLTTVSGSIRLGTSRLAFQAGRPLEGEARSLAEAPIDRVVSGGPSDQRWVGCSLSDARSGVEGAVVVTDLSDAQLDFLDMGGLERAAECARRALDSVAEYERQRLVALELQRDLLPPEPLAVAGIEVSARYQPGAFATQVGGDWYDVVSDDARAVLVVGDLAGSGIRAAADMGRVRLLTRVLLQGGASVPETFESLNGFCAEEDLLATVLAVTLDRQKRTLEVISAGHPPPVVRHGHGASVVSLSPGPPLGIGGEVVYPVHDVALGPTDTMVMFTDGLIEKSGEMIDTSIRLLVEKVATVDGDPDALCDQLIAARTAEDPSDDIAVLAFRLGPGTS